MNEDNVMGIIELRERLSGELELPQAQAKRVTDTLVATISDALAAGRAVELPGLGSWKVVQRAARAGTGPDGRAYTVPAKRGVKFRASRRLAGRVAG